MVDIFAFESIAALSRTQADKFPNGLTSIHDRIECAVGRDAQIIVLISLNILLYDHEFMRRCEVLHAAGPAGQPIRLRHILLRRLLRRGRNCLLYSLRLLGRLVNGCPLTAKRCALCRRLLTVCRCRWLNRRFCFLLARRFRGRPILVRAFRLPLGLRLRCAFGIHCHALYRAFSCLWDRCGQCPGYCPGHCHHKDQNDCEQGQKPMFFTSLHNTLLLEFILTTVSLCVNRCLPKTASQKSGPQDLIIFSQRVMVRRSCAEPVVYKHPDVRPDPRHKSNARIGSDSCIIVPPRA